MLIAAWLSRISIGFVCVGTALGLATVVWPLRLPGAMQMALALWAAAAICKVIKERLLGTPWPKNYGGQIDRSSDPIAYNLVFMGWLIVFTAICVLLVLSAIRAAWAG